MINACYDWRDCITHCSIRNGNITEATSFYSNLVNNQFGLHTSDFARAQHPTEIAKTANERAFVAHSKNESIVLARSLAALCVQLCIQRTHHEYKMRGDKCLSVLCVNCAHSVERMYICKYSLDKLLLAWFRFVHFAFICLFCCCRALQLFV